MDDDLAKLAKVQRELLEQFVKLTGLVTEIRASVNVLKLHVATQLSPGTPELGLKVLAGMETELLRTSPDEQERLKTVELIETLKSLKKHGPPGSA
jgi:hypothetical protein